MARRPTGPQASIEFEVEDADAVASAGGDLQRAGFELLHPARTKPWGQTVTRLLTDDGLIIGISYAPHFTTKSLPERPDTITKTQAAAQAVQNI
jgi:hypothetical protein